ncbi:hypothetical protein CPC08DRAFT_713551 [Agrocybe pediades]|nr:hypothetical protein CPC08DRAFT_713551 [Agrocybe pediades]
MAQSSETLVQLGELATVVEGPRLTLTLVRPNKSMDHAIVIFPDSYEEAVTAALEVFCLTSESPSKAVEIELRCLVKKDIRQEWYWSRIHANQWKSAVNPEKDEIGVFLVDDGAHWKEAGYIDPRMSLMSAPKKSIQAMFFIAEKASKKEDRRILIAPIPQTYEVREDCILAAYAQFNCQKMKNGCRNGEQITLSGRLSAVNGGFLSTKLTPASYILYLTVDRGLKVVEVEVSW